uniref:Uncharacterized protein n=1 Tax=Rhizobium rhizogenes TaxID=359 RepID=A0A7S4ZTB4_RHIRH|nr:hypothetical protein pC5.8a_198 [Rhizobium rhizogenes]
MRNGARSGSLTAERKALIFQSNLKEKVGTNDIDDPLCGSCL